MTDTRVIYKVKPNHKDVPVRMFPNNRAEVMGEVQGGDRIIMLDEENGYVQILEMEMDGITDKAYSGYWVFRDWLQLAYDGRE